MGLLSFLMDLPDRQEAYNDILPKLLQGLDERDRNRFSTQPSLAQMMGGGASAPEPPFRASTNKSSDAMRPFRDAISSIESEGSGGYSALGPVTGSGDRAYGKYQVMGANIPQWTTEALGTRLTPQQFLASPKAQDAVFDAKFGSYVDKYGPQDAAAMWFTGRRLSEGGASARDVNRMSGAGYVAKFQRALDYGAGGGPSARNTLAAGEIRDGATGLGGPIRAGNYNGQEYTYQTEPALASGRSMAASLPTGTGGIIPDGMGGMVPDTNSRYNRLSGDFLPSQTQTADAGSLLPSLTGMGAAPAAAADRMPSGQRTPSLSNEFLIRALRNPYSAAVAQGLLMQRFKREQPNMQVIDIPAVDDRGNYTGSRKALFDPHSGNPPVPFGPIDTSRARERAPTSVQEYEYGQAHPEFRRSREEAETRQKAQQLDAEIEHRGKVADRLGLQGDDREKYILNGKVPTAAERPMTESQANTGIYADRMFEANKILSDPRIYPHGLNYWETQRSKLPLGAGNYAISTEMQQYQQAKLDFLTAVLRKESGATILDSEMEKGERAYFPVPGNPPEVIAQKAKTRETALAAFGRAAGPLYKPPGNQPAPQVQTQPQGGGLESGRDKALPVGKETVINGFRVRRTK